MRRGAETFCNNKLLTDKKVKTEQKYHLKTPSEISVQSYFSSYINKSMIFNSWEFKRRKLRISKLEELTLNYNSVDCSYDKIDNIADDKVDFIEEIATKDAKCSFKEIVTDKALNDAISKLTNRQREILYKCLVEDKEDVRVSEELAITKQAVNKIKKVAIYKIRKKLGVHNNG